MHKQKKLTILALISLMISTAGCSNNKVVLEKGKINSVSEEKVEYEFDEAELYRDEKTGEKIKINDKDSWYANNVLSDRAKHSYSEIRNAIKKYEKEIIFSKNISEDEFTKVMNIVYFDTPEAFAVKYSYTYEVDENNNVKKLNIDYVFTKDYVNEVMAELNDNKINLIKNSRGSTDIQVSKEIFEKSFSSLELVSNEERKGSSINNFSTVVAFNKQCGKLSLANSLKMVHSFRSLGIDAFVKVGTITDSGLTTKNKEFSLKEKSFKEKIQEKIEPPTFKNSDISKYMEVKKDGSKRNVLIHPEYVYSWVMVNIDNKWLNMDPYYDYISNLYRSTEKNIMFLVPDYILAASRSFVANEQIFGVIPTDSDIGYMSSVSDKALVLEKNKADMHEFLKKEMEDNIKNKTQSYYHQFTDKETMSLYIREFPQAFEEANKASENSMIDYKIAVDTSRYLIEIKEIRYSI